MAKTRSKRSTSKISGNENPAIPSDKKIAVLAYDKWCARGCTDGCAEQDWAEAHAELAVQMVGTGKRQRKR